MAHKAILEFPMPTLDEVAARHGVSAKRKRELLSLLGLEPSTNGEHPDKSRAQKYSAKDRTRRKRQRIST